MRPAISLAVTLEDMWHAEYQLLELGADAEVVEPAELRERLAATSRAIVSLYDRSAPSN